MTSTQTLTTQHQQLYETDFIKWIDQATELLKQSKFDELDIENLIEEIETLGRSEKGTLRINLRALLIHLLKWEHRAEQRNRDWASGILEYRHQIQDLLTDSPSLRDYLKSIIDDNYKTAREIAADEIGLNISTFPTECSYTAEQMLDEEFLPGEI